MSNNKKRNVLAYELLPEDHETIQKLIIKKKLSNILKIKKTKKKEIR